MSQNSPRVLYGSGAELGRCSVRWDAESLVLSASIFYAVDAKLDRPVFMENLDRSLGVREAQYRVVIGELDILLDGRQRLSNFEIRTNPRSWEVAEFVHAPDGLASVYVSLAADFDHNNIAMFDGPVRISRDEVKRELSLGLAGFATFQSARVADCLVIGSTADGYLSELRLACPDGQLIRSGNSAHLKR